MGIAGRSVWKDDSDGKQTEMHSLKQAKRRTERNLLEMQKNVPISRRREPAGLSFEGHEDAQKGAGRGGAQVSIIPAAPQVPPGCVGNSRGAVQASGGHEGGHGRAPKSHVASFRSRSRFLISLKCFVEKLSKGPNMRVNAHRSKHQRGKAEAWEEMCTSSCGSFLGSQ